jgi:hypothetical protein
MPTSIHAERRVLWRIDSRGDTVAARLPIAGVPHGIAFGLGRVWVALA